MKNLEGVLFLKSGVKTWDARYSEGLLWPETGGERCNAGLKNSEGERDREGEIWRLLEDIVQG